MSNTNKEEYKWDLSEIYKDKEIFLNDISNVEEMIKKLDNFKGSVASSASLLLEFLKLNEICSRKVEKMGTYVYLSHYKNLKDTEVQDLLGIFQNIKTKYSASVSFLNPELLNNDYSKILKFISLEPKLKEYEFSLEQIFRYKKHILSEKEEKLLAEFGIVFSKPEDTYDILTNTEIAFGNIKDENGKYKSLNENSYSNFIESKDRIVRKRASEKLMKSYSKVKNTAANLFVAQLEILTKNAKVRKFPSSIEASLFSDNISLDTYNNIVKGVNEHLHLLHKYYEIKRKSLNLDNLHSYDVYAPISDIVNKEILFEDAKKYIIESVNILGGEYKNVLESAFNEGWIDAFYQEGKRSGAFSSGSYDTKPYLLLNYENKLDDVLTLAHELGHSMHSYFSNKNQNYSTAEYKIFVAEVASMVNELLLSNYLLNKTNDNNEKKYIINNLLDTFVGTIFTQIQFSEFEQIVHQKHENGETLTYETLNDIYYNTSKKYDGNNVVLDDMCKYGWIRIPHFYYNFYVYKYAVGLSCAFDIVSRLQSGDKTAVNNYLNFLSSGSKDYPTNLLKIAGVDVSNTDYIKNAMKIFDNLLNEFDALVETDTNKRERK